MVKDLQLSVWVDKLTNSIENTISGESFPTEVTQIQTLGELKTITKIKGWNFNWKSEFKNNDHKIFKLSTRDNPSIIQGLISLKINNDHVYISIIENAPFNVGKRKLYRGVPGNLFAYACKLSWDLGNQGAVAFVSKSKLIKHYEESLGAIHIGNHRMIILPTEALKLIKKYFLHHQ